MGLRTAASGLVIALLSPVFGAVADAAGRRKPWIAGFGLLLMIGTTLMWIGKPGDPSLVIPLLFAYAVAIIGAEFATVFNNAMMPTLVPPERMGRLSGTAGDRLHRRHRDLIVMLGFCRRSEDRQDAHRPFAAVRARSCDARRHRAAGPLTALWFFVFVMPMFLFTPDQARNVQRWPRCAKVSSSSPIRCATCRRTGCCSPS